MSDDLNTTTPASGDTTVYADAGKILDGIYIPADIDETDQTPSVVEALIDVMRAVRVVGKEDHNKDQHYDFRGIDAVVNAVGPALRAVGVLVVPTVQSINYRDVQTSRGKPSREVTVLVRYRFYGPKGDHLDVTTPGESMDVGDKGTAKAMSVAFRIALIQALSLPTDDVDPDDESYERGREPEAEARYERPSRREYPRAERDPEPTGPRLSPADKAREDIFIWCGANDVSVDEVAAKFTGLYDGGQGDFYTETSQHRLEAVLRRLMQSGIAGLEVRAR